MPLVRATEVTWKPPPRCPVCGVGVTAAGRNEPVPVDYLGQPHCKTHGPSVAPNYAEALAVYRERRERLKRLHDFVMQGHEPASNQEIKEVIEKWRND